MTGDDTAIGLDMTLDARYRPVMSGIVVDARTVPDARCSRMRVAVAAGR
jgi:hypothetical protein